MPESQATTLTAPRIAVSSRARRALMWALIVSALIGYSLAFQGSRRLWEPDVRAIAAGYAGSPA